MLVARGMPTADLRSDSSARDVTCSFSIERICRTSLRSPFLFIKPRFISRTNVPIPPAWNRKNPNATFSLTSLRPLLCSSTTETSAISATSLTYLEGTTELSNWTDFRGVFHCRFNATSLWLSCHRISERASRLSSPFCSIPPLQAGNAKTPRGLLANTERKRHSALLSKLRHNPRQQMI
jgi:hypothetical protein